jgi:hypothetical protein
MQDGRRQLGAQPVRVLRRAVERVSVAADVADRAARLDRIGGDAIILQSQRNDVLGLGEGGVGRRLVTKDNGHGAVAVRAALPDLRCVGLEGILQIDHRRQGLVVDRDELGGLARLRLGLGDDEGDAVTDATRTIGQQHRPHRAETLGPTPVLRHEMGRDAADLVRDRIGADEDQQDAGRRPRRRHIDTLYLGVRMRRENRDAMTLPRQVQVADIRAPPRQEALVLDATNSLTDAERDHRHLLVMAHAQSQIAAVDFIYEHAHN